jgi:cytosine/adenosine deaminase-related metal-dependent hydrolase
VIYKNGTIITVDEGRRILTDGALAIDGDRIVAVGKATDIVGQLRHDAEHVDLHGGLVIPGLINTHVHLAQCLLRGCADDLPLRHASRHDRGPAGLL